MGRFIWLFGENLGATSNNNSYYMWRHVVERDDDIEKYFIMEDNKPNRKCYKSLPKAYRKFVVWRNTIKHLELFVKADMRSLHNKSAIRLTVLVRYGIIYPSKIFIYLWIYS